jgi:hypothetical protein
MSRRDHAKGHNVLHPQPKQLREKQKIKLLDEKLIAASGETDPEF